MSKGAICASFVFFFSRIVGEDDGGKLFTVEQYEEYKRKMVPQRMKNRLYVSFGVPGGIDCKLVGPETQCFCSHRYVGVYDILSHTEENKYIFE